MVYREAANSIKTTGVKRFMILCLDVHCAMVGWGTFSLSDVTSSTFVAKPNFEEQKLCFKKFSETNIFVNKK